jgi:hypothetical protein
MDKGTQKQQTRKKEVSLQLVHPMAADIDMSVSEMVVAIPEGIEENNVRKFGTMTCDSKDLAKWLQQCGIETVAMESTGIYWQPPPGCMSPRNNPPSGRDLRVSDFKFPEASSGQVRFQVQGC